MGGQVEAVYDKLHRMKAAFIYSSVALRMEIALRAVNPPRPSTRGFAHHNSLEIQHLHRKHRSLIGSVRHNRLTMRDLHRTPSHGPCMVLVWSLYGPCMVPVWSYYSPAMLIRRVAGVPIGRFPRWRLPAGGEVQSMLDPGRKTGTGWLFEPS